MKNIISLVSAFLFTLTGADAATVIQITNLDSQNVSTFRLGIESENAQIIRYTDTNKIGLNLYSWYPQWNNNFSDVWFSVASPVGEVLETGTYHTNLYLFGFYPNRPQLEWGILDGPTITMNDSNNRSWFRVLELSFNTMAIDAYDGEGNFISARHNTPISLTSIPEPSAPVLMSTLILFLWRRSRRK